MAFISALTPVLAKDSESFSWLDAISVAPNRMQRDFEGLRAKETCGISKAVNNPDKVCM